MDSSNATHAVPEARTAHLLPRAPGATDAVPPAGSPEPASSARPMGARRVGFAALVLSTSGALLWLMALTLFEGGVDPLGLLMLVLFALTLPWTTIGFWNAVIGFMVMTFSRDPARAVAPDLCDIPDDSPLESTTALLVCVRNEDTRRLQRNLEWMLQGLVATGHADAFHLYLLSDTDEPAIAAAEAEVAAALSARFGASTPVTWRQREQSTGFKAGNIRDFCERWGSAHPFAIVLDADSVMTAQSMLRLVRIMQARPHLGIVQTLVTGLPSASPFARVFQFGMRMGMRSYTLGSAAWQGDCGPYWGHNAILRVAPFTDHCQLPVLPGSPPLGGHVLSHDQVEAVLMRRAGYEVRVLPVEDGSWEENPPALPEFIRRDLRWCQGNMQYLRLLGLRGLLPVSRIQLVLAIAMYIGSLAWIGLMFAGLLRQMPLRPDTGLMLFAAIITMTFAPKLATLFNVLARRQLRTAFGGTARVLFSAFVEIVLTMLLAPVSAVAISIFLLGLPLGRRVGWTSQQRDAERVPLAVALRCLWPQALVGVVLAGATFWIAPGAFWFGLPIYLGLLLAVPLAMASASPALGRAMARAGICRTPDETWPAAAAADPGTGLFAPGAKAALAANG
jgi:membrane glycosyltransferase